MSNPLRASSLDAQTTEPAADDLDEPPPCPPSRGIHFNNGPPPADGQGGLGRGHGTFTLSRQHSQQLSAQRRKQINQHQQGHSGDSSSTVCEELSGLAPPPDNNIQEESGAVIIHHPSSPNPHSHHPYHHHHQHHHHQHHHHQHHSPITHDHHPQSRWQQQQQQQHHPQDSQPNGRQEATTTVIFYDTQPYIQPQHQNHSHSNPPQQQQQQQHHQHFSYTSPPESHQSASLASSTSDSSSFLRHPHDPRLLQAQYQATASSFDLTPDPDFTPNASDLVPIQLQASVTAHTHIPQPQPPPFVAFPAPGPAPFIHAGDDDFYHPHPHPHPHPHHHHPHHHHRQNGVLQFPGGYPISFMQNPELSILNAESFDDGVPGFHAPRSLPPAGRSRVAGEDSGKSRKRAKTQSVDTCEQEEEEEKKRSRGRPRLDTNDETAKDRRRTQIRLAQRAYRNRKETAIQTLEKKVDQLRSNNEEMSKAFMKLYDFAVGKGMLDTAPEFGKQLQATTEKFYSLARGTSEDGGKDVDMVAAPDHESEEHRSSPNSNPDKPSEKSPSPDRAPPEPQAEQVLYGGYMVDHTSSSLAHHPHHHQSHALTAVHTTSWAHNGQALEARTLASQAPLGYEIVTEPTPDNASFPFGMSLDSSGLDAAGLLDPSGQPLSFSESPYSLLSAPSSYAYQERTFGRRLQRSTLERAYVLMRMPNPPPDRIASVFGFCMLFEPREKIVERLANRLSVNQRETLFNWRFPFLHLGGGGTFFDEMRNEMDASDLPRHDKALRTTQQQQTRVVGNQGSLEPERQKIHSMYGIGPWDAQTEEIRDARVDHKLRMSVPGFDGDFYDADEVEWSLRQRGVVIPPAADFVTAEINPADFTDEAIAERSFNPLIDNYIATTMAESNFNMAAPFGDNNPQPQSTSQPMNLEATSTPTLEFMGTTTAQGVPSTMLDPTLGGDLFGLGASSTPGQVPTPASNRRTVTINVGMLVHELGSRSVCLGRSPGIRPKDVNAAFWSSLAA